MAFVQKTTRTNPSCVALINVRKSLINFRSLIKFTTLYWYSEKKFQKRCNLRKLSNTVCPLKRLMWMILNFFLNNLPLRYLYYQKSKFKYIIYCIFPSPLSGPMYSITHSTTTLKKPKDYNNNTFQCWTTQSCDLAKIPVGAALMIMMRRRRESWAEPECKRQSLSFSATTLNYALNYAKLKAVCPDTVIPIRSTMPFRSVIEVRFAGLGGVGQKRKWVPATRHH